MRNSPFMPQSIEELSTTVPIFPLPGVLLLPRGVLPLNIFEPRYITMIDDALAGDRMIGIIQPLESERTAKAPPVYSIGCAGRITGFEETDDGRYLISLTGVTRFRVERELPTTRGYRRVVVDWLPFERDFEAEQEARLDRTRLSAVLGDYFKQRGIVVNWDAINDTPDERLITSLSMICPFEPPEKQALLEAPTLADRAGLMLSLIEMAVLSTGDGESARH